MLIQEMHVQDASYMRQYIGLEMQTLILSLYHIHDEITPALISGMAQELLKEYPQYQGHFDGWFVVKVVREVHTKLGQAFYPGDITIAIDDGISPDRYTAFSFRNVCSTVVSWYDLKFL